MTVCYSKRQAEVISIQNCLAMKWQVHQTVVQNKMFTAFLEVFQLGWQSHTNEFFYVSYSSCIWPAVTYICCISYIPPGMSEFHSDWMNTDEIFGPLTIKNRKIYSSVLFTVCKRVGFLFALRRHYCKSS